MYDAQPFPDDWVEIDEAALQAALGSLDYTVHGTVNSDRYCVRGEEFAIVGRNDFAGKMVGSPKYFKPA